MGDAINLEDLIKESVDGISERFGDLSDRDLTTLHMLEGKGGKRTTLLSAIDHEQKTRLGAYVSSATEANVTAALKKRDAEHAEKLTAALADRDEQHKQSQAEADANRPASFTQEQVDEMLAQKDANHTASLDQLQTKHETALAEARGQLPGLAPETIERAKADGAVSLAALKDETVIRFVDREGVAVDTLPGMTFGPRDFEPNGNRIMLMREVEFPIALPDREVAGALLLDGAGDLIGEAELVQPFGIGGGRPSKLPPRTLSFG